MREIGLLVVGGLFIVGFVINVATGDLELANSLVQFAIAGLCVVAYVFARRERLQREAFFDFVASQPESIRAGTATYRGQPVTYATRARMYQCVVSFLIVSITLSSRVVLPGERADRWVRAMCSLITLLFGWWGFPWGPILTIRALRDNARGGIALTVGELIEGSPNVSVPRASAR